MEKQILKEIKELKAVLARVIGTADLATRDQFSKETIAKVAQEYKKLSIERGEWVKGDDLYRVMKGAHYQTGRFIREVFGFKNYFKKGQTYYYYRKDILALDKELRQRNVDLGRYMELKADQEKFKKYVASATQFKKGKQKAKPYELPEDTRDVTTSSAKLPSAELVREDIKRLKEEFFQHNMAEYVDIYHETHAMFKHIYFFEKYIDPAIKRRCRKWCDDFNYANHALELVTKKKEKFVPVKEDDMIQL